MPGRAATLLMSRGAPDLIHLQSDQGLGHPGPAAGEHRTGAQEPQDFGAERELGRQVLAEGLPIHLLPARVYMLCRLLRNAVLLEGEVGLAVLATELEAGN